MNQNFAQEKIAKVAANKRSLRRALRSDNDPVRTEKREKAHPNLTLVLGRVVQSPTYGRGYISEIEDGAVRVRFWRHGCKTFYAIEAGYPFELIHEVRPLKTRQENPERYCVHNENPYFCCSCAGLTDEEIEQWKPFRTNEGRILVKGSTGYSSVLISTKDVVCPSRRKSKLSASELSDWYECHVCGRITETPASKGKKTKCAHCQGTLIPIGEPFQVTQFSPRFRGGAEPGDYAGDEGIRSASNREETINVRDLYLDPNSRIQRSGTGCLRIPLDDPRSSRSDAPAWLHHREEFFKTFKSSRASRAEHIFSAFYLDGKTDSQMSENLGWRKDSIKKERSVLIREGNRFFGIAGEQTPP